MNPDSRGSWEQGLVADKWSSLAYQWGRARAAGGWPS